jgi:hypothetical protein
MQVKVDWQKPIQLTKHRKVIVAEKEVLSLVQKRPGIYFFSRKFGTTYKPFYIGETKSVRGRLKNHWRSANIQFVLRGQGEGVLRKIKGGERYFHYGYLMGNPQDPTKRLKIGQRYLIRKALEARCPLINIALTNISMDYIEFNGSSAGRAIYPKHDEIEAQ